ncbi:MAG: hypothetical protein JAY74_27325 [Candidatus Thiodiazotropha taylori]|nr:hypothetical protein [Candidatus Thiodiazotropha taylori]
MKPIKCYPHVQQALNEARESIGDRAGILFRNWAGMDETRRAGYLKKAGFTLKPWSEYSGREQYEILEAIRRVDSVTTSDAKAMGVRS